MFTTAPAIVGEADESNPATTYRPHLDGLRAVAVYLVLLFHAGSSSFSSGYIGVDVFFVLSGFLVTQLLLRDIDDIGSIQLARFYSRRFRRLLPAAFVTLIVTALVYSATASPVETANATGSFTASFLYSANWYFIDQATGYFGADISASPVLHFWSLAVEEQFYLAWPLALAGLFMLTRSFANGRMYVRIAVLSAAVASACWALALHTSDPNRAYYGTDTRAYELLSGAFIALIPEFVTSIGRNQRAMRFATLASAALLLAAASSWVHSDAIARGIGVTLITCVLLIAIEGADGGAVKRFLSSEPMVYLGKISYGTYLWHWIVIIIVGQTFNVTVGSMIAITAVIATALASLSFQLIEGRIRTSPLLDRYRRTVVVAGLATSVVAALVLIPAIMEPSGAEAPTLVGDTPVGFAPVPPNIVVREEDKGRGEFQNCYGVAVAECTLVHGDGPTILLIGDSHAQMLVPTFVEIAKRENLTLSVSTKGFCPWQRNLYPSEAAVKAITSRALTDISIKSCREQKEDLFTRVIPELQPDVVVAMNLSAYNENWRTATRRTASEILDREAQLVMIEPIPRSFIDPLTCLSSAEVVEECRFVANEDDSQIDRFQRQLAVEFDGVYSANFDRLVCPFYPICDPILNGQAVRWDPSHLTIPFAKTLAPAVGEYLKQLGLVPS